MIKNTLFSSLLLLFSFQGTADILGGYPPVELIEEFVVGLSGLEPPTSRLSGARSNLLSYEPMWLVSDFFSLGFLD